MNRTVVHLARGREWRGGEFQVLLLARALRERGRIGQVILTGAGSRLAAELGRHAVPVEPMPWAIAWDPRVLPALIRQLNALRAGGHRPLVHAHDSHALALALLARGMTGVPVVATRRSITRPGSLWRRPNRVIAISHAVALALREGGVPPETIAVAPSAVDEAHLREVNAAPAMTDPPSIVAIGAATEEKGHRTLRAASALLEEPRPRLTILTDGVEDDVLASASLFIQPSLREALGTAVLVAMARGIPVIASRTGGLIELLEGDAGLLVPPGDAPALAQAIQRLLGDAGLRDALVKRARARVEEYRPGRMADRVTDVYASVLDDPGF